MSVAVIVPAAGRGERAGIDKVWADVAGRPILAHVLERVGAVASVGLVVVVCP
ncbi:MAG: 2-C-methyl-D-erythritol 4-phosphate cytidylyltransferase, partial [Candidatus Dormiibacterota bacterium]